MPALDVGQSLRSNKLRLMTAAGTFIPVKYRFSGGGAINLIAP
jgi:hypothetical protein